MPAAKRGSTFIHHHTREKLPMMEILPFLLFTVHFQTKLQKSKMLDIFWIWKVFGDLLWALFKVKQMLLVFLLIYRQVLKGIW